MLWAMPNHLLKCKGSEHLAHHKIMCKMRAKSEDTKITNPGDSCHNFTKPRTKKPAINA